MKKKILSVLLSLCLLVGTFPAVAQAQTSGNQTFQSASTETLPPLVDKTELYLFIAKAEDMVSNEEKYVALYMDTLKDTLAIARGVAQNENATAAQVQEISEALLNAILAQRFAADKSILEDLVAQAEKIDVTGYTPESVAAFYAALEHAREILADETLGQDDQKLVDEAVARLSDAINGLTAMPEEANKTLLEKTVTYALELSTEGVIEAAKQQFQEALDHAQAVLNDPYASQQEVDAAWDALLEGIWGLGLIQGDKTELGQLINQAQQMVDNQDKYVT